MMAGRPAVDMDTLKPEIIRKFNEGKTYAQIATELGIAERTIKRRARDWGLRKRAQFVTKDGDPELRAQVAIYWSTNLTDEEIVIALKSQGWNILPRTVRRIRQ